MLLMDATGAYHRQMTREFERGTAHVVTPLMRLQDAAYTKIILVTLPEVTPVSQRLRCRRIFAARTSNPMPGCSTRAYSRRERVITCWRRDWWANASRSNAWPEGLPNARSRFRG